MDRATHVLRWLAARAAESAWAGIIVWGVGRGIAVGTGVVMFCAVLAAVMTQATGGSLTAEEVRTLLLAAVQFIVGFGFLGGLMTAGNYAVYLSSPREPRR